MPGGLDIAIVGCGVAGLASATLLARDRHRVTLFERFETPAPVGSGLLLQPTGLAVLKALGLDPQAVALGTRIARLHGRSNGRDVLDVRYESLRGGRESATGIHRSALFDLLYAAALAAGAQVRSGKSVSGREVHGSKVWVSFEDGSRDGPFDLMLDASGSRTPLAKQDGEAMAFGALWANVEDLGGAAEPATLSQRYRRAEQMAGLLPIGRAREDDRPSVALFWSLRSDELEAARQRGIAAWRDEWCRLWPEAKAYAKQIQDWETFTFAAYRHRTLKRPVAGRIVHLGDSWHSTSPQLGQGANMALLDAYALALALRCRDPVTAGLDQFVRTRAAHVRMYQWLSLWLTPVYQSQSRVIPWIRDRIVAPVSRIQAVNRLQAAMVAGLIGDPLTTLGLAGDESFTDRASRR